MTPSRCFMCDVALNPITAGPSLRFCGIRCARVWIVLQEQRTRFAVIVWRTGP